MIFFSQQDSKIDQFGDSQNIEKQPTQDVNK